jgi:hypothetical protein
VHHLAANIVMHTEGLSEAKCIAEVSDHMKEAFALDILTWRDGSTCF